METPGLWKQSVLLLLMRGWREGSKCGWKDEGGAGMSPQWISKCIQHFASLM